MKLADLALQSAKESCLNICFKSYIPLRISQGKKLVILKYINYSFVLNKRIRI